MVNPELKHFKIEQLSKNQYYAAGALLRMQTNIREKKIYEKDTRLTNRFHLSPSFGSDTGVWIE
jgi:hypothetical protein